MCPRWRNVVLPGLHAFWCTKFAIITLLLCCAPPVGYTLVNIYFVVACVVKEMP